MNASPFLLEGAAAAAGYSLAAPRTGPVNRTGASLAARAGSSLEFRDYRGYEPGDDLRHIDWNAFGRSDQLTVKLFREEVAPHLDLLVDGSRSMALAGTLKARSALALAGFFTAAADNAGFSHSGWLLAAEAQPLGDRRRQPAAWNNLDFNHSSSPIPALTTAATRLRPRSVRVLLSDLFWDIDPAQVVRQVADRAASAAIVQILADVDARPSLHGHLRLLDVETGQVREIRVDRTVHDRYLANLRRLQSDWHACCRASGVLFATVIAEELLRDWRLEPLIAAGMLQIS